MQPRFKVPSKTEIIVNEGGFQKNRLFRFFDELSKGAWNEAFPDTDGTITYYTVTASPAVVSLVRAQLTPYQKDDRTWLLDINITLTVASGARTGITVTLANTKFKNLANLKQPVLAYAMDGTAPYPEQCYAVLNTGNIIFKHASATTTTYSFRAERLELEEKPAYAV